MYWNVDEKMPSYDDIHEFEVWIYGYVRRVRRVGNRSMSLTPGTLVYVDCTHPMQNMLCDEREIKGWRYASTESIPAWQQESLPAPPRDTRGRFPRLRLVSTKSPQS